MPRLYPSILFLLLTAGPFSLPAFAQSNMIEVKGMVFDITQKVPLDGVTVMATNGKGTMTDSMGRYSIWVRETDSVFFSYQNRVSGKYPVLGMQDPRQFSMALHVYTNQLPPVTIYGKNYRTDSLANRAAYAKYFNWSKPNPLKSVNVGGGGAGMDPNEIINLFRFKRNRQLGALQARLVKEEQDKYVDFRYNRKFVKTVTNMSDESLSSFMFKYRPPYDFVMLVNDLELGYYIQQCYKKETGELPSGVEIYLLGIDPLSRENRKN
jgi:hypothetical protein